MKTIKLSLIVLCLISLSTVVQAQLFNPMKMIRPVAKGFSPRVIPSTVAKRLAPAKTNLPVSALKFSVSRQIFAIKALQQFNNYQFPKMSSWDESYDHHSYDPNGRYLNFPEPPQITGANAHTAYREYTGNKEWTAWRNVSWKKQEQQPFSKQQTKELENQNQNQQEILSEQSAQKEQLETNADRGEVSPTTYSPVDGPTEKDPLDK